MLAAVFVDSEPRRIDGPGGEVGKDDRDVSRRRHHRVGPVRFALEARAGMRMHVSDDRESAFAADRPELGESVAVKDAHAGRVGLGIEVVVEDRTFRFPASVPFDAEKKGTWTIPNSARISSSERALPAASTRETTSVDMASATTSWITVPTTINMAPRI